MSSSRLLSPSFAFVVALAVLALSGCATTRPVAYTGIASAPQLAPNNDGNADRIPYIYTADVDWSHYSAVLVDAVTIYRGPDAQFEKIDEREKKTLSGYMLTTFRERLQTRFRLVNAPAPGALRVKLTLTGAKPTPKVLGTVTRFDVAGGAYNITQSARGGEGALIGSVSFAVEIFDAETNRLLSAYVSKQFPNAMNVAATFGRLEAAKVGIEKGAEDLLAHLN